VLGGLIKETPSGARRGVDRDIRVGEGGRPGLTPARARRRADDLAPRLTRRMAELDQEEQLKALPPVMAGEALVVSAGMLTPAWQTTPRAHAGETARGGKTATGALPLAARALGREPEERPHSQPRYDIPPLPSHP